MACLDMYNNSDRNTNKGAGGGSGVPAHHFSGAPMSPRISFSNDFVESSAAAVLQVTATKHASSSTSSSDFEFSVTGYSMMSGADELFSKGRLLPFRDRTCRRGKKAGTTTTLREELLAGEEEDDDNIFDMKMRPPKGGSSTTTATTRLKGLLGLRKSHIGSKKAEPKTNAPAPDAAYRNPASQELDVVE
ncbi:hypothetical protein SAY86_013895 [Trapa natans]|uniref:Uncharacterized protein n=1 Tax=Trapa natans TaxID=22666 RepID=A0AAN7KY50_TRANT|nr:hypothetical protein SAY86_013895 [Trapa natans]